MDVNDIVADCSILVAAIAQKTPWPGRAQRIWHDMAFRKRWETAAILRPRYTVCAAPALSGEAVAAL